MINLTTLSDGEPHPSARVKVLSYAFAHTDFLEASITGSRLAVLRGDLWTLTAQVVVWDWITGQIVLVRVPHVRSHPLMQAVYLGTRGQTLPVCDFPRRLLALSGR